MKKVYSHKQIVIATLLGGPLAAGYTMARNFSAFGEKKNALRALAISIIFTIFIGLLLYFIPDSEYKVPRHLIPVLYTLATYFFVTRFQAEKISDFTHKAGDFHSSGRTVVVMLLAVSITILPLFFVDHVIEKSSIIETSVRYFGGLNQIRYEPENISAAEVDKIGEALIKTDFFAANANEFVFVKKSGNSFELFCMFGHGFNVSDNDDFFTPLRKDIQKFFPENKIIVNVVDGSLNNILLKIET